MSPTAGVETGVLVVDDQEPFRRAMAAVVEETDGFVVVGAVASGEESLVAAEELAPELVLMDVNLPGIDGIEATRQIRQAPDAPVVILLSTYDEDEFDRSGCGAAAYVSKASFSPDRLAGGVVGGGLSPLTPERPPPTSGGVISSDGLPVHPDDLETSLAGLHPVEQRESVHAVQVDACDSQHQVGAVVRDGDAQVAGAVTERLDAAEVGRGLDPVRVPRPHDLVVDAQHDLSLRSARRTPTGPDRDPTGSAWSGRSRGSALAATRGPRWPGRQGGDRTGIAGTSRRLLELEAQVLHRRQYLWPSADSSRSTLGVAGLDDPVA